MSPRPRPFAMQVCQYGMVQDKHVTYFSGYVPSLVLASLLQQFTGAILV
jgi:hypothetical protein